MKPRTTILDAMAEPTLFGNTFLPRRKRADTWEAWRAFLAALFALSADEPAQALISACTERTDVPNLTAFNEAYCICGRRGGKSIIAALIASYLAALRDYSNVLAPGETGVVLFLASDKKQARVMFGYVLALLKKASALCGMITGETKESVDLSNHVRIEIATANYKSVRGFTLVAVLADEIAFWQDDTGANPADEVLNAVRPGMASIPGSILLGLSSPYAKRGALFEIYKENFGKAGASVLVWRAASRTMNSTISERTIAASRQRDPTAARSEWDAEFRADIESFVPLDVVEACTPAGRHELLPASTITYKAFVDPSGGSSDSMTLAISHEHNKVAVLDLLREITAPFSPDAAVRDFCRDLKRYRVSTVTGDAYAGEWPREKFSQHGITYKVSEKNRSELYLDLLPLLMSGQCELLDNPKLKNQLVGLERRTGRSGKDSIDHIPGSHDDVANAAAGALVHACGGVLLEWFIAQAERLQKESREERIEPPSVKQVLALAMEQAGLSTTKRSDWPKPKAALIARLESCTKCGSAALWHASSGSRCNCCGNVMPAPSREVNLG